MTPREILLQELEAADDGLITDLLTWLEERKSSVTEASDKPLALQEKSVGAIASKPITTLGWATLNDGSSSGSSFVAFFRNSPLCDVADDIDLSRDQSLVPDRVSL